MEDKEKIIGPRINVKYSKKSTPEILFNWIMAIIILLFHIYVVGAVCKLVILFISYIYKYIFEILNLVLKDWHGLTIWAFGVVCVLAMLIGYIIVKYIIMLFHTTISVFKYIIKYYHYTIIIDWSDSEISFKDDTIDFYESHELSQEEIMDKAVSVIKQKMPNHDIICQNISK